MKVSDSGGERERPQDSRNGQPNTAKPELEILCLWQNQNHIPPCGLVFLKSDPVLDFHEILNLMLSHIKIIFFHYWGLVTINLFKMSYKQPQASQESREWSRRPYLKQMWQIWIRVSNTLLGQRYLAAWWICSGKTGDHPGKTKS